MRVSFVQTLDHAAEAQHAVEYLRQEIAHPGDAAQLGAVSARPP
jgi:hypothetical protein